MSGHPHKGKRSEWFSLMREPPKIWGLYEAQCKMHISTPYIRYIYPWVIKNDSCPSCQWRGLAEKPE